MSALPERLKTLAERLAWARAQTKKSQAELAKLVGVSQSTIGNLEAGSRFSSRNTAKIAATLGVNALWLEEGVGEPYSCVIDGAIPKNNKERELLELFAALPVREQDHLINKLRHRRKEIDQLFQELFKTRKRAASAA